MSIEDLPLVSVQADWDEVIREVSSSMVPESSFWVACYRTGHESVQGSVEVRRTETNDVELEGKEGIQVVKLNSRSFKINCEALGIKDITVYSPKTTLNPAESKPISCIDISPNGHLFAAAIGNEVNLGHMANGQIQMKLTGHLADVTTVQFFPSNLVVLTGGADFLVKIWSVLNGSNPVTLKGHTSAITSTAIIAQGRNVLSSSRDGTVRLWNCGTSSTIATIGRYSSSVNKMILTSLPSCFAPAENVTLDPLEVETSDKLVLCALEDGSVRGIHLGTKEEIFATSPSQVPLTALAYDSQTNTLLTGNAQGLVQVYTVDETKTLDQPQRQWKRNGHAITGLLVTLDQNGERVVCVSAGDGSIFQTNSLSDLLDSTKQVQVLTELTGNELETVYEIKAVSNLKESESQRVVCAVRDGKIRIY